MRRRQQGKEKERAREELFEKDSAVRKSQLTPQSSNVRGYNYDPKSGVLTVTYKSGGTYQYTGVPKKVYRALQRNKSVGKTLHKRVKLPGYKYEKLAVYQEGGSFTHDGKRYDLDKALRVGATKKPTMYAVKDLEWVLAHDSPDPKRVKSADLASPVLIAADKKGRPTVVDGLHRLAKAKAKGLAKLPGVHVDLSKLAFSDTVRMVSDPIVGGVRGVGNIYKKKGGGYEGKKPSAPNTRAARVKTAGDIVKVAVVMRKEHKNPKGGLTAKGRAAYNKATGSNLKPGVRGKANTPEKMRRKGSFLSRMFGPGAKGPMVRPNGKPSRRALSAAAWGEPVPKNDADRARLYAKGQRLLQAYKMEKKAQGVGSRKPGFETRGGSTVSDSDGKGNVDLGESKELRDRDSPLVTCQKCGWYWRMSESDAGDVKDCHKCGGKGTGMVKTSYELGRTLSKLAGQAKKQVTWQGLPLKLEHEKGDERSGVNGATGKKWSRVMKDHYGYVPGTYGKGADGDAIDIYLNPDAGDEAAKAVYKVRQKKKTGEYDEDKFMIGYASAQDAKKAFLRNMPAWAFGSMTSTPFNSFKSMVGQGKKAA